MIPLRALKAMFFFPPIQALVALFWIATFMAVAEALARQFFNSDSLWVTFALAPGALLGYYTFVRVIERRTAPELASAGAPKELLAGLLLAAMLMSLVVGIMQVAGAYSADGVNRPGIVMPALVGAIMAGTTEELLIRAAAFRILERWLGSWLALALTAGLFGATHLPNPNASALSTLVIVVGGGVMLCAAWMITRRIWFVLGIHVAWNFFQGGVFGVATSGVTVPGLINGALHGPTYVSGGAFGPEGSVVTLVICAGAATAMLANASHKGHFIAMQRRL